MDKLEAKIDLLISGQALPQEGFQSLELQQKQKNIIECVEKFELKLESKTVKLEKEVADLKRKIVELETSLDFDCKQYENNLKKVKKIEKLHNDLKLQTDNLARTTRFTSEITNSIENQGRKMMLEIDGIPTQNRRTRRQRLVFAKGKINLQFNSTFSC